MDNKEIFSRENLTRCGLSAALRAYQSGDFKKAIKHWIPLAEEGNIEAQNHLGYLYAYGIDFKDQNGKSIMNFKTAMKWYTLSAEQGDPEGQTHLATRFKYMWNPQKPFWTSQYVRKAIKWYTAAAKQGYAEAQFKLGEMYGEGRAVKQDYKIKFYWWSLAAERGHAEAQNDLGLMYSQGRGVPRNEEIAVKWFTLSAKQGLSVAQCNLAFMYEYGYGVVKDYKYAHVWYALAHSNFHPDAYGKMAQLKKAMTAKQISAAELEIGREAIRGTPRGKNKLLDFMRIS